MIAALNILGAMTWDPGFKGVLTVALAVAILCGSVALIVGTNSGARLGFLIALAGFMGPERRFQFHLKEPMPGGHVIIDDYAHHPDELRQSIASVKALYPGQKLTVAFQPHLYSRTRDFAPGFAAALSQADDVVLLDIYPAREEPIPGVSSRIIFDRITSPGKILISKDDLRETIKNRNFEILLVAGAGDIVNYVEGIVADTCGRND